MAYQSYNIGLVCILIVHSVCDSKTGLPYKNQYGDDYGKTWVFFPTEDGQSYYVDMDEPVSTKKLDVESNYNIQFRLHSSSNNPDSYVLLDENAKPINDTSVNFKTGAPVKLITHGWMSSADKNSVNSIKDEYLKGKNYNIITVDWSDTADFLVYPVVAPQTKIVGNIVGKFLDALSERYQVTGSQVHLIGHSLGAHVMGNAAYATKLRVSRVTGLDPARPMFELPPVPDNMKLDKTDADFVDVIHTCSAVLGVEGTIGHADFFPNSGYAPQPGCDGLQRMFESCSHGRAPLYFAESINTPQGFTAKHCPSWNDYKTSNSCDGQEIFMGEECPRNASGVYYLTTTSSKPYGRKH